MVIGMFWLDSSLRTPRAEHSHLPCSTPTQSTAGEKSTNRPRSRFFRTVSVHTHFEIGDVGISASSSSRLFRSRQPSTVCCKIFSDIGLVMKLSIPLRWASLRSSIEFRPVSAIMYEGRMRLYMRSRLLIARVASMPFIMGIEMSGSAVAINRRGPRYSETAAYPSR